MLRRQETDAALDLRYHRVRFTHGLDMSRLLRRRGEGNIALVPPIQLSNILDTAASEPRLKTKWYKEVTIGMFLGNFHDTRI
jgi:hypothetical protein